MEKLKRMCFLIEEIENHRKNLHLKKDKKTYLFGTIGLFFSATLVSLISFLIFMLSNITGYIFAALAMFIILLALRKYKKYKKIKILKCSIKTFKECQERTAEVITLKKELIDMTDENVLEIYENSEILTPKEYEIFNEIINKKLKDKELKNKVEILVTEENIQNY